MIKNIDFTFNLHIELHVLKIPCADTVLFILMIEQNILIAMKYEDALLNGVTFYHLVFS